MSGGSHQSATSTSGGTTPPSVPVAVLPPVPPLPPAPALPALPASNRREAGPVERLTLALIAAAAVFLASYSGAHTAYRAVGKQIASQNEVAAANLRAQRAQSKADSAASRQAARRQARQAAGQALREERRISYSAFVQDVNDLRASEQAWVDEGAPAGRRSSVDSQLGRVVDDRLDLQIVAACRPRKRAIVVSEDQQAVVEALSSGRPSAKLLSNIDSQVGHFIAAARSDLRHFGRPHVKGVCK